MFLGTLATVFSFLRGVNRLLLAGARAYYRLCYRKAEACVLRRMADGDDWIRYYGWVGTGIVLSENSIQIAAIKSMLLQNSVL